MLPWGRATVKADGAADTTLYLHVFQWPSNNLLPIPGLKNRVLSARLLGSKGAVKVVTGADGVALQVPPAAPDAISSTIVLKIQGTPDVEQARIRQDAQGQLTLPANQAMVYGKSLTVESKEGKDNLGFWTNAGDWADWAVAVTRPGRFRVTAELAAEQATTFTVRIGDQSLRAATPNTGGYNVFQKVDLGVIDIKAAGNAVVEVRPAAENWRPLNLRSIQLVPIP
jgi:alpha-L-fucosidase